MQSAGRHAVIPRGAGLVHLAGRAKPARGSLRVTVAGRVLTGWAGAITGRPAAAQAVNPPSRSVAWAWPSCCKFAAARLDWYPWLQTRMIRRSRRVMAGCLHADVMSQRHSRELRGSTIAPGIRPSSRRWSSPRMSMSSAPLAWAWKASAGDGRSGRVARARASRSSTVFAVRCRAMADLLVSGASRSLSPTAIAAGLQSPGAAWPGEHRPPPRGWTCVTGRQVSARPSAGRARRGSSSPTPARRCRAPGRRG